MYRDKLKVIGAIALALSLTVEFLALSATNVVFAADQSSKPSSQPQVVSNRVPGWCNYDGDQDQDDWCWSTTAVTTTTPITATNPTTPTNGNGYAAPAGVVPYGTIIGQNDKSADTYGSGYNYNYMGGNGYNNRYDNRFYLYRPGGLRRLKRLYERRGIPFPPFITNGQKFLLGRGKWWWWMP